MDEYSFEIQGTDMIVKLNDKPVYKGGYHPSMDYKQAFAAFYDCVHRLENVLRT